MQRKSRPVRVTRMFHIPERVFIIALVVASLAASIFREPCRNSLSDEECLKLKKDSVCHTDPEKMKKQCTKACGFCKTCQDNVVKWRCLQFKRVYSCQNDFKRMKLFCPETCGFCPPDCGDKYHNCPELKSRGYCVTSPDAMRDVCGDSCGFCKPKTPCDNHNCPFNHKCAITADMKAKCLCISHCSRTSKTGPLCSKNGTTFENLCALRKEECRLEKRIEVKYYGKCSNAYRCRDADRESTLCGSWKKLGVCQLYTKVMQLYCPRTCGLCRQPSPSRDCTNSPFGCCWDTDKPAIGLKGKGCKACRDSKFCLFFAAYCGSVVNRALLKENCPATCGYCALNEGNVFANTGRGLSFYEMKAKIG